MNVTFYAPPNVTPVYAAFSLAPDPDRERWASQGTRPRSLARGGSDAFTRIQKKGGGDLANRLL